MFLKPMYLGGGHRGLFADGEGVDDAGGHVFERAIGAVQGDGFLGGTALGCLAAFAGGVIGKADGRGDRGGHVPEQPHFRIGIDSPAHGCIRSFDLLHHPFGDDDRFDRVA